MERYTGSPINAWPSFADLMLSVVLVLVTILVAAVVFITTGTDYGAVELRQEAIREKIEQARGQDFTDSEDGSRVYVMSDGGINEIRVIESDGESRITFGDRLLFDRGEPNLSESGRALIAEIGKTISPELEYIREVQIHGHTDPSYDTEVYESDQEGYQYNLNLGSQRAADVFQQLQAVGVNPVTNLMSIASYGPYRPVNRSDNADYDAERLAEDNTGDLAEQNRRIELLLHFNPPPDAVEP
jgi:flagellar motor protein MotB